MVQTHSFHNPKGLSFYVQQVQINRRTSQKALRAKKSFIRRTGHLSSLYLITLQGPELFLSTIEAAMPQGIKHKITKPDRDNEGKRGSGKNNFPRRKLLTQGWGGRLGHFSIWLSLGDNLRESDLPTLPCLHIGCHRHAPATGVIKHTSIRPDQRDPDPDPAEEIKLLLRKESNRFAPPVWSQQNLL